MPKPPTAHSRARPSCYHLERRVTSLIACEAGSRGRDALLRDPAPHVSTLFRFRNLTEANLFPSTDRSWPRYKNLSLGSLANRYHDAALRPKSQLREALLRLPLTNREAVRGFAWPKHLRPCVPFPHGLPRPLDHGLGGRKVPDRLAPVSDDSFVLTESRNSHIALSALY